MTPHEEPEKENSERWLLTYSDLITLLLAFFIILYAISTTDKQKFEMVADSMRVAMGAGGSETSVLPYSKGDSIVPMHLTPEQAEKIEQHKMENAQKEMEQLVKQEKLDNNISISLQKRGLVVSISSYVLFESGSAVLSSESTELIEKIADMLSSLSEKQIRVEGHTDTDPIRTRDYPSNWELSSARATNVLRILLEKGRLKPEKLSAVGYGEYRPLVPNTTPQNKAKNRRVDIVIIRDEFDKVDPHALEQKEDR